MTQPEIARRCLVCGVSIREVASFCPQCGNQLPQRDLGETQPLVRPPTSQAEVATPTNAPAVNNSAAESGREARKDAPVVFRKESQTKQLKKLKKKAAASAPASDPAPASPPVTERTNASVGQAARGAVGAKIQRATTLARDVEGDVKDRARKVRQISSVVLDEAGDDPSLRFVLVAAVLFVLFLIIVVLNKFID